VRALEFNYTPINLFKKSANVATVTSDAFEGGLPFDTPAKKVLLTKSLLVVELPFVRTSDYSSKFAYLPIHLEVDEVRVQNTTVGAPNYTDTFISVVHQGKEYLLIAATNDSIKWPTWTSTWSNSFSAAMTGEFHMLGRLGLTSWGDYLILTAE